VLVGGPADGTPVLLVHGNCSSAEFWVPLLRRLPDGLRVVVPDLRGYGRSETAPVDATRGLRDFADDVAALLDDRDLFPQDGPVVVAAHSMGCGVVMQMLADHPGRAALGLRGRPGVARRGRGAAARHGAEHGGRRGQLPGRRQAGAELAGDRTGRPRRAEHDGAQPLQRRRGPGRRRVEAFTLRPVRIMLRG
jgi:pimeloyl-ACP methyl ester carboxylesterase